MTDLAAPLSSFAAAPEELGVIRLASPCNVKWSSMKGDGRVRFCDQCQLNVYDVQQLTSYQVRDMVMKNEGGRTCMRFFKRFDGTLLTRDCPQGLALLGYLYNRERMKIGGDVGTLLMGVMLFFMLTVSLITVFGDNIRRMFGMSAGMLVGDDIQSSRKSVATDPRAAVLAKFNVSPPCPTSRPRVRS